MGSDAMNVRPLPDDPGAPSIQSMIDTRSEAWCAGSGQPLLDPCFMFGTCAVCGKQSVCHDEGSDIAWRHRALSAPKEDR